MAEYSDDLEDLHDVVRNVVVVSFAEDFVGRRSLEDFGEPVVVGDVAAVLVFDKVDEAREVVEYGGKVVLDFVRLKKSVILHALIES